MKALGNNQYSYRVTPADRMEKEIEINISMSLFNDCYKDLIDKWDRYELIYGGASSGKSHFTAMRLLIRSLSITGYNALCLRKVGRTVRQSSFTLLKQLIHKLHLESYFIVNETKPQITCTLNGNEILFAGLDDVDKLKSITSSTGIIVAVWIEEGHEVSQSDFEQANLRLRGSSNILKQITITLNPVSAQHWSKHYFVDNPTEKVSKSLTVLKTTFRDNKFLTPEDRAVLEDLVNKDKFFAQVYGLGEWGVLEGAVFNNWDVVDEIPREHLLDAKIGYGADWGYSVDPSTLIKIYQVGDHYYLEELIYETGLNSNDYAKLALSLGVDRYAEIIGDCSEPRTIDDVRKAGLLNIKAVSQKNKTIKPGIDLMKTKYFHVLRGSVNLINELTQYRWKKRGDQILPDPCDAFNHAIDGVRYYVVETVRSHGLSLDVALMLNQ